MEKSVVDIYIELRLEEDGYVQREWRKHNLTNEFYIHSESFPVDSKGQRLSMIPFVFIQIAKKSKGEIY